MPPAPPAGASCMGLACADAAAVLRRGRACAADSSAIGMAALPLTACGARIACGARSAGGGGGAGTAGASTVYEAGGGGGPEAMFCFLGEPPSEDAEPPSDLRLYGWVRLSAPAGAQKSASLSRAATRHSMRGEA